MKELRETLLETVAAIDEASKPQRLEMPCTFAELARQAVAIGGKGSYAQIECKINKDGKDTYKFSLWGPKNQLAMGDSIEVALDRFRREFHVEPKAPPATTETVNALLAGKEVAASA